MAQKRRETLSMHLHSLQLLAHVQRSRGTSRPKKGTKKKEKCKLKLKYILFFSPKKVKYFALKNQALCLHQSQTNVNENLIKILVSAEYLNWNFQ